MTKDTTSIRTRYLFMTETDWSAFADALAKTYPQARYFCRPEFRNRRGEEPKISFHPTLLQTNGWGETTTEMIFHTSWTPQFRKHWHDRKNKPDDWEWYMAAPTLPYASFRLRDRYSPSMLPERDFLWESAIHFYFDREKDDQKKLMQQFYRLLSKLTTNRNQISVERKTMSVINHEAKGSLLWAGHDAIRWALEKPHRVFCYQTPKIGIRPASPRVN